MGGLDLNPALWRSNIRAKSLILKHSLIDAGTSNRYELHCPGWLLNHATVKVLFQSFDQRFRSGALLHRGCHDFQQALGHSETG